jgi:hypothetical protein
MCYLSFYFIIQSLNTLLHKTCGSKKAVMENRSKSHAAAVKTHFPFLSLNCDEFNALYEKASGSRFAPSPFILRVYARCLEREASTAEGVAASSATAAAAATVHHVEEHLESTLTI